MTEFPSVVAPNRLKTLLQKIVSVRVPPRVSMDWLESVGYTSSNDRAFPKALEFIGFLDSSRKPTERWTQYLDSRISGSVLADAIRESYSPLYQVYPSAHQQSDDDLRNFFRPRSGAGDTTVSRTLNTFKMLCSLADFDQEQVEESISEDHDTEESTESQQVKSQVSTKSPTPTLHINIQIHIPSDASPEQIDKIFSSMAKHLYNTADDSP